jgi:hypothetical protein
MMMLPNSKPRAVGTPRSQPDGGVYPQTASINLRQDFLPPIGGNSSSRDVFPPGTVIRKAFLSVIFVLPQMYSRDSKHIAPKLSTRVSPIRF